MTGWLIASVVLLTVGALFTVADIVVQARIDEILKDTPK